MNNTLLKSLIRMIRTSLTRFFAVLAIVTIGVAFFTGVAGSSRIMAFSVDRYNDENMLKDITVYSNYGFDDEDIEAVNSLAEIKKAEGARFTDAIAVCGKDAWVTRIHSFKKENTINQFILVSGRLPENEHEALAEKGSELEPGFPEGSTVYIKLPDDEKNEDLKSGYFLITGTVDTPLYLNEIKENSTLSNQYLRTYLYVNEDAFTTDYYTELNAVAENGLAYNSFDQPYEDYCEEVRQSVISLAHSQQRKRYEKIRDEALEEYEKGVKEYEDARREFEDRIREGEQELIDGQAEITEGQQQLADAEAQAAAAQNTLEQQVREGQRQIDDALRILNDSSLTLAEKKSEFEKKKREMLQTRQILCDGIDSLKQAKDGLRQIDEGLAAIEEAEKQLLDPKTVLLFDILRELDPDTEIAQLQETAEELIRIRDEIFEQYPEIAQLPVGEAAEQLSGICETIDKDYEYLHGEEAASLADLLAQTDPETPLSDPLISEAEGMDQLIETVRNWNPLRDISDAGTLLEAYADACERSGQAYSLIHTSQFETIQKIMEEAGEDSTAADLLDIDPAMMEQLAEMIGDYTGEKPETAGGLVSAYDQIVSDLEAKKEELISTRQSITDALAGQGIREDEIDLKIAEYEDLIRQIDEGIAKGEQQLREAESQLADGYAQAQAAQNSLDALSADGRRQIAEAMAEINTNRRKLLDALEQIRNGYRELEDARKEGLEKLKEAEDQLKDARKQIDALETGKWTVLDRTSHYASATYKETVRQMAEIGRIFPLFFILVAALVCLTTMTRMVSEQRTEIGVLRALGYSRLQCASRYLIYALAATAGGCLLGTLIGLETFPRIIYNTWRMLYILPPIVMRAPWDLIILTAFMFMGSMGLTAYSACRNDMREVPASLLRPKVLKNGRKALIENISLIWNRLSFIWKVTIRNIFRYRRRFIMTVIGVAGCCALMVTGFGIRDSINAMVDLQFNEILCFDGTVSLKDGLAEEEINALADRLENREDISSVTRAYAYSAKAHGSDDKGLDETVSAEIFRNPADLSSCYLVRTRTGHQPLSLDDDGVIISERLAENLNVKAGDTFRMEDCGGTMRTVRISAVCEMYIFHHAFMSEAYYRKLTEQNPKGEALFIKADENLDDLSGLQNDLLNIDEVGGISFYDETLNNFSTMVKSLDLIVWMLLISSMALAFVVLGNLIHINTSERQREIATLKVLGFRRGEVQSYIFKENNILTVIGALAGLPVGNVLHHYIMRCLEMDYVMFGSTVSPLSFVISAVLTAVFGTIVNRLMVSSLDRIRMVESLKSVE